MVVFVSSVPPCEFGWSSWLKPKIVLAKLDTKPCVLVDLANAIDLGTFGLRASVMGAEVHTGAYTRRRLSSIVHGGDVVAGVIEFGQAVLVSDESRRDGCIAREGVAVGRYHAWATSILQVSPHIGLAVDATDANGEILTMACSIPDGHGDHNAAWLPIKVKSCPIN